MQVTLSGIKGTCPGRLMALNQGNSGRSRLNCPCDGLYSAGMEKSTATAAVNAVVGVSQEESCR